MYRQITQSLQQNSKALYLRLRDDRVTSWTDELTIALLPWGIGYTAYRAAERKTSSSSVCVCALVAAAPCCV